MRRPLISFGVTLAVAFSFLGNTAAQLPPPDDQEERLLREKPPEKKVSPPPQAEVEKRLPPELPSRAEAAVKFRVTKIIVEGATVFTQEELHKITAPYENKDTSLEELNSAAEKITLLYQNAGYITSQAYIPPQKIKMEGEIIIRVFEGKVGKINIQGNNYFNSALITRRFERLEGKILNQEELRLVLSRLNKNPDLEVKATLIAGERPQTTDILLIAKDEYPHHFGYEFNRRGGRLTKYYRHALSFTSNEFFGLNDSLSLQVPLASEEGSLKGLSGGYALPLNGLGTELGLAGGYTKVKIGKEYKPAKVRGVSKSFTAYVQHPLYETVQFSTEGRIGFETVNSSTEVSGDKIILNKLRVLNLGCISNGQDSSGRSNISASLQIGLPEFMDGSGKKDSLLSPAGSTSKFLLYELTMTRLEALPFLSSYLIFSCQGQYSPDKLTNPKKLLLGGAYSVRGYPEGDASGDYGFNTIAELRTPCFIIPDNARSAGRRLKDLLQLAFFTDTGTVYDHGKGQTFLAGSGLGLRIGLERDFTGRVDFAWPLADESSDKKEKDFQIHFSLAVNY